MELLGFDLSVTWLLVIGLVLVSVWYDWWCHQYFQRRGIPVADYIPFFGNILQFRHGVQFTWTEYVKKHGRVVGMYDFRRPVLIINDPDILKNVLVKNFSSFHNRRISPLGQKPLNRGLTQLVNEEWKEIRNVITPSFSASKMRLMSETINECCDTLVASFSKAQEGGRAADCRVLFGAFTMDAIARCGFGLKVDSQQNKDDPFVKNAKNAFDFSLFNPAFLIVSAFPALSPIFAYLKFDMFDPEVMKFFMNVTEAACNMRKQEGQDASKHIDLLQLMLNAHEDEEHEEEDTPTAESGQNKGTAHRRPLSTVDVMAQAVTFFLAGYETTNTLLCFTAYLLATNQDTQEKLHAEIDNLAPTRDNLGYDVIAKMEYLDMVINESLRMYPPAVAFERMCNETFSYEGLTIEKGINVMVSLWTLHYDEEFWPNPTKFDPERFSPENKASIKPCTYMPFGFGPRNCIGMRFALLEAKMALVRVLQQYRFDVCSETEIPPKLGKAIFLAPKIMKLSAVPRN
ncbi:cytochrome P450 3A6-like [Patiria miniata]|uniref:Thromboxane-A synthase n=1 Tax=Patiria miniata TaxID=46514 RepID=A0A914AUS1_PATMI|nr:cytochrome P450 3A6-like [Patiria miniata]XP_038067041.1 cytochrome P450 3A6-like [Patiria miniata]